MQKAIKICMVLLFAFIFFAFLVPLIIPWTRLNCRYDDIDINTGRIRLQRYLLYCKISAQIRETPISEILWSNTDSLPEPDWRRVNTFSPGLHHSPHHLFHGAIAQIKSLQNAWYVYDFSEALKKKTAQHILALWRHDGSYSLAGAYINCLDEMEYKENREAYIKQLLQLEMPLIEENEGKKTYTVFYPNGNPMDRYQTSIENFIKQGIHESWYPDGQRQTYGYYNDGLPDGFRFMWDQNGELQSISAYTNGTLTEYESEALETHPEYETAQKLNQH